MGLLDLYGDAFSDQQKAALQQRGLLGFLGGLQKSGALDYTAPFLSGKVPGGFAAGVAGGMAGMGEAQDAGALNAMRAQQLGLVAQELRGKLGLYSAASQPPPPMYGGVPSAAGPSAAAPGGLLGPAPGGTGTEAPTGLLPALGQAIEAGEASGEKAVSPAGAIGIRQVLPSTAADYGVSKEDLFDVGKNRAVSDQYLGDMLKRYNGDVDAAIVAYNAGPKRADQFLLAGKDPSVLPAETQRYLPKVKAAFASIAGGQGAAPGLLAAYQPGQASAAFNGGNAPQGLLSQIPGANPRTGGVPIGTPGASHAISSAEAAAQNAQLRASGFQGLPMMPSNYIFGKGLVAPPGAGTVSGNAAAAPGGGLLAQAAQGQPPQAASPAPQPSAAAPGGTPPPPAGTPFAQVTGR